MESKPKMTPMTEAPEEDEPAVATPEPKASPDETKADAFVRLMNHRVTNARKFIRLIGNLSNTNSYEYEDEQVDRVLAVLEDSLEKMALRFSEAKQPRGKNGDEFRL